MTPIGSTTSIAGVRPPAKVAGADAVNKQNGSSGFNDLLGQFIEKTNDYQVASDQSIEDLVTGKTDNIQQVVLSVANAEMSFQLFMEMRNKLVESYNELMRMQF